VLTTLLVITLGKPLAALAIVLILGYRNTLYKISSVPPYYH